MFNVGPWEILLILLFCLIVFGPERLPEIARQIGRMIGRLRLFSQEALNQVRQEADLKDLNLPELRVGSLRAQAREYVRELMDIDGQMAELELERLLKETKEEQRRKTATPPPVDPDAT